jgi:hypothetical protein
VYRGLNHLQSASGERKEQYLHWDGNEMHFPKGLRIYGRKEQYLQPSAWDAYKALYLHSDGKEILVYVKMP